VDERAIKVAVGELKARVSQRANVRFRRASPDRRSNKYHI